jgi:hypothetical protein
VLVPFVGLEHDWAALEVGAWAASATGVPLTLIGVRGRPENGRRDATRILADASLVVQQVLRIAADLRLVDAGREGVPPLDRVSRVQPGQLPTDLSGQSSGAGSADSRAATSG